MKVIHKGREIDPSAVDYGDGNVMVRYMDNDEVAVVPKSELKFEDD